MNMLKNLATAAAVAALGSVAVGAAQAQTAPPYYSSAAAATINLTVLGQMIGGVPIDKSTGAGPPAYLKRHQILNDHTTIPLPVAAGGTPLAIVLNVPVGRTRAHGHRVAGHGDFTANGLGELKGLKFAITTLDAVPVKLLLIKATRLRAEAEARTTAAGKQINKTQASAGILTISGTLLGTQVIQLSGPLQPGVVFTSPIITITADKVITGQSASGQPQDTVDALEVRFTHGKLLGTIVTGEIVLATATAS